MASPIIVRAAMPTRTRILVAALAIVAAAAFALGVQDGHWWSIGEVTIGPFGSHHCFGGACRATGLAWIGASDLWMRAAVATGAAGLLAAALLVMLGAAAAAGRFPTLLARMGGVAIVTATLVGAYFLAGFHGVDGAHAAPGRGIVLYFGAIPLGLGAAVMVLRARTGSTGRAA